MSDTFAPKFLDTIRTAWMGILQREYLPDEANFFELGGDSLQATRILLAVHAATGVEVTLAELYQRPTLIGFATYVSHK